jgi:hypothetical protein
MAVSDGGRFLKILSVACNDLVMMKKVGEGDPVFLLMAVFSNTDVVAVVASCNNHKPQLQYLPWLLEGLSRVLDILAD